MLGAVGSLLLAHAAAAGPNETPRQSCQTRWMQLRGTSAAAGWTQSRFIANCLHRRGPDSRAHAGARTETVVAATAAAAGIAAAVAVIHPGEKPASP